MVDVMGTMLHFCMMITLVLLSTVMMESCYWFAILSCVVWCVGFDASSATSRASMNAQHWLSSSQNEAALGTAYCLTFVVTYIILCNIKKLRLVHELTHACTDMQGNCRRLETRSKTLQHSRFPGDHSAEY